MIRKIAGKTFSTPEEAGVTAPTEAEIAEARRMFAEFRQKMDAVAPEDRVMKVSRRFRDDLAGTEYDPRRQT